MPGSERKGRERPEHQQAKTRNDLVRLWEKTKYFFSKEIKKFLGEKKVVAGLGEGG